MKEWRANNSLLVLGQVRVTSEIIPEPKEFFFGLFRSTKEVFRTWVSECKDILEFRYINREMF